MGKTTNDYVAAYQSELEKGDIQVAYERLQKYMMALKAQFSKEMGKRYSFGSVSPGYMDFTYFPFFNDFLREKKLRFGIVLNHRHMRFELWLMGQNMNVQKEYWNLLKSTKWNKNRTTMPKYSVLETVLVEDPDFDDLDALSMLIQKSAIPVADEIISHITA